MAPISRAITSRDSGVASKHARVNGTSDRRSLVMTSIAGIVDFTFVNPIEHLLIGWAAAQVVPLDRRDRAIVTIASVVPDVDGFGALPELLPRGTPHAG